MFQKVSLTSYYYEADGILLNGSISVLYFKRNKKEPFGFKSHAGVATGLSTPALYLVKGQAAH